jgi:Na+-driven multidrug efflux pump
MEQGWDPEVKNYFVRILNTIAYFLLWLMSAVTAGIYFRLGYRTEKPFIFTILFYVLLLTSLALLLRYYYRVWKK